VRVIHYLDRGARGFTKTTYQQPTQVIAMQNFFFSIAHRKAKNKLDQLNELHKLTL
jgi:hypothetical protein